MYSVDIATEAEKWIADLAPRIQAKKLDLTAVELYIHIDDEMNCHYYIVDRKNQSLFWVSEYDTDDLGLPDAVSASHLSEFAPSQNCSNDD